MRPRPLRLGFTLCLVALLGAACRPMPANVAASPAPLVRIYDARASRWITFDALAQAASRADMLFIGEQHDDPVTHGVELALLAAVAERRGGAVLSLEMFERDVQPLLDRYLAGAVSEADFLAASRPWDRYATDYRPLVELARVRGWPVVASNVPRRIASAVSRRGLAHLDSLGAADRAFVAAEHACPRDRYFERFAETAGAHGSASGPASAADAASARAVTERFYEAQCVKDEAMGEAVAQAYIRRRGDVPVVHVDGAFHSDFGLGTVERARRRAPRASVVIVTAVPVADPARADVREHTGGPTTSSSRGRRGSPDMRNAGCGERIRRSCRAVSFDGREAPAAQRP